MTTHFPLDYTICMNSSGIPGLFILSTGCGGIAWLVLAVGVDLRELRVSKSNRVFA
jgi:hypothetical protein